MKRRQTSPVTRRHLKKSTKKGCRRNAAAFFLASCGGVLVGVALDLVQEEDEKDDADRKESHQLFEKPEMM